MWRTRVKPPIISPDEMLRRLEQSMSLDALGFKWDGARFMENLKDEEFARTARAIVDSKLNKLEQGISTASSKSARATAIKSWQRVLDRIDAALQKENPPVLGR